MGTLYHGAARLVGSWASSWAATDAVRQPLEPVLNPSRERIRTVGLAVTVAHPLFYWIWAEVLPQPWESLPLRMLMCALGLALLVTPSLATTPPTRRGATVFVAIAWITWPVFFFWMYLCNAGNTVWLASLSSMFLIYYQLTDWRLATIGSATGLLVAGIAFAIAGPSTPDIAASQLATNAIVVTFSWCMALLLALSASNLRREQLNCTLATMGIVAHELRTPLATISLMGDVIRGTAPECDEPVATKLDRLGTRLNSLVRAVNYQIDTQIANARLMRPQRPFETVSAAGVVRNAVSLYPFRSSREQEAVVVRIHNDFRFRGSQTLFTQVITNLLKNALRSLAAATTASHPGDLLIEIGSAHDRGRIVVSDRGVGMDAGLRARIFQPFFSVDRATGHGLGLAFCQRVVHGAGGSIRVKSEPLRGAIFTIELPLAQ